MARLRIELELRSAEKFREQKSLPWVVSRDYYKKWFFNAPQLLTRKLERYILYRIEGTEEVIGQTAIWCSGFERIDKGQGGNK